MRYGLIAFLTPNNKNEPRESNKLAVPNCTKYFHTICINSNKQSRKKNKPTYNA